MSKGKRPVINIINLSLGFTGLERGEEGQRGIEGFFKPKGKLEESAGTGVAVKKVDWTGRWKGTGLAGRESEKGRDQGTRKT
jgi:hypothetical protein